MRDRAARMAGELADDFAERERGGASFDEALNGVATLGYCTRDQARPLATARGIKRAAECHSAYVMARNNAAALGKFVEDPAVRAAMQGS
eukprot:gene11341-5410_t